MTSEFQPVTQQGRMATPAKVCFSFQLCLTLLLGQKCSAPPGALPPNPGLPLLPFWDLPSSTLVSYFWCCASKGRDAPSNFPLAYYNLLSWSSF